MKKISRNEGLLILGQWTSKIGDIVFDYVNSIAIVSTFTNSMWILALYQNSQVVINILFNLIGGVVADLGKRKNIIIVSDCLSAIICFFASFFLNRIQIFWRNEKNLHYALIYDGFFCIIRKAYQEGGLYYADFFKNAWDWKRLYLHQLFSRNRNRPGKALYFYEQCSVWCWFGWAGIDFTV